MSVNVGSRQSDVPVYAVLRGLWWVVCLVSAVLLPIHVAIDMEKGRFSAPGMRVAVFVGLLLYVICLNGFVTYRIIQAGKRSATG